MRRRLPVPPRKAGFDEFVVEAHAARQNHLAFGPPTLIQAVCFHGHLLAEDSLDVNFLAWFPYACPLSGQSIPFSRTRSATPLYITSRVSPSMTLTTFPENSPAIVGGSADFDEPCWRVASSPWGQRWPPCLPAGRQP